MPFGVENTATESFKGLDFAGTGAWPAPRQAAGNDPGYSGAEGAAVPLAAWLAGLLDLKIQVSARPQNLYLDALPEHLRNLVQIELERCGRAVGLARHILLTKRRKGSLAVHDRLDKNDIDEEEERDALFRLMREQFELYNRLRVQLLGRTAVLRKTLDSAIGYLDGYIESLESELTPAGRLFNRFSDPGGSLQQARALRDELEKLRDAVGDHEETLQNVPKPEDLEEIQNKAHKTENIYRRYRNWRKMRQSANDAFWEEQSRFDDDLRRTREKKEEEEREQERRAQQAGEQSDGYFHDTRGYEIREDEEDEENFNPAFPHAGKKKKKVGKKDGKGEDKKEDASPPPIPPAF